MNTKIFKIIIALFLICITFSNVVFATDINLNLPGTSDPNTVTQNNEAIQNNETVNSVDNTDNPSNVPTTNENSGSVNNNDISSPTGDQLEQNAPDTETLAPSNISSVSESGLGTTNIINILLITVGVILILLAIAIIIRLKN